MVITLKLLLITILWSLKIDSPNRSIVYAERCVLSGWVFEEKKWMKSCGCLTLWCPSRENQWWMIIILKSKQEMLYSIIFLTSLSDSTSTWSYSLKATKNMMDVTFSKQWIHFRRSDRCPPTSTILKLYDDFVKTLSLWSIMLLK